MPQDSASLRLPARISSSSACEPSQEVFTLDSAGLKPSLAWLSKTWCTPTERSGSVGGRGLAALHHCCLEPVNPKACHYSPARTSSLSSLYTHQSDFSFLFLSAHLWSAPQTLDSKAEGYPGVMCSKSQYFGRSH